MFYNAIKKKGWQGVKEDDMVPTVAIHNAVNEHCWQKVMEWESMHKEYAIFYHILHILHTLHY